MSFQVHYEDTRVYIEFKSRCESVPSSVNLGVYMAVQMRLLRFPICLKRYTPAVTKEKLEELERKRNESSGSLVKTKSRETGINFSLNSSRVSSYETSSGPDEDSNFSLTGFLVS